MTYPIVCPTCVGEGVIWNNADTTSGQGFDCEDCAGTGEREATADELQDMAEAEHERIMSDGPDCGAYTPREAWGMR